MVKFITLTNKKTMKKGKLHVAIDHIGLIKEVDDIAGNHASLHLTVPYRMCRMGDALSPDYVLHVVETEEEVLKKIIEKETL